MGWPKSRAASKLDKEIAALSKKLDALTKTPSAQPEKNTSKGKGDGGKELNNKRSRGSANIVEQTTATTSYKHAECVQRLEITGNSS